MSSVGSAWTRCVHASASRNSIRALSVTRRDNDQIGLARTLERLGDLGFDEGHRERANANWVEALKIREGLHHSEEANALRERIRGGRPSRR